MYITPRTSTVYVAVAVAVVASAVASPLNINLTDGFSLR
jgi:hypothetical protein